MLSNPIVDKQLKHVSVRAFKAEPIDDEMLTTILEAGRRSPTSSNLQTYSIIIVRDSQKKATLSRLAGNQQHIIDCPVFLIFCADLFRVQQVCNLHSREMTNNLETFILSTVDASLVGMSVQTAAESFNLGAVMVGGIRNNLREVSELLELPRGVYPVYGMSLGWPDPQRIPPQKPRLPRDLIIHEEHYERIEIQSLIEQHDIEMAKHYDALGSNLSENAWSGPVATKLSAPLRPEIGQIIKDLGFNIA